MAVDPRHSAATQSGAPSSAESARVADDATRVNAGADRGDSGDFSLADLDATTDTPRPARPGVSSHDGTVAIPARPADVHHAATQDSGSATAGSQPRVPSSPVLAGFADYELQGEVARGGMGVVYRARQLSLNRIVAVKMILAGQLASEGDVQRFRSEAEAAANLQHPNIVSIYEVGEYGGQHYFSMQFIDGRSLSELVREGLLPARRAARIVQTVADAVQYAHGQGILHRDLKPSNILVDSQGEPHLTDFGVAKRLSGESQLTATGAILGTPGYMPPEQAAGMREVGPAADVYALGAILYEVLTGRPPFKGERIVDVLMQVMNAEPVSPRILNPSVPEDLATVCLKCLEKDPARRYPTAAALSADLGRWLDGEPIEARPIGRAEQAWRWCKRSPLVAGLSALLVLLGIGAFIGVTSQWLVAQTALRQLQEAQAERAAAQVDSLLQAAPDALLPVLENLQPAHDAIAPHLRELLAHGDLSDRARLRASLALLPSDPSQAEYLRVRLLSVELGELLALRAALTPHREQLRDELWQTLEKTELPAAQRFSAGILLAGYDPSGAASPATPRWRPQAPFLAGRLLESIANNPSVYEPLVDALQPARFALIAPLAQAFRDTTQPEPVRAIATSILIRYAADQPLELASLLLDASPLHYRQIQPRLALAPGAAVPLLAAELEAKLPPDTNEAERDRLTRRQAQAGVALVQLGQAERVWPWLAHREDPRLRSWLIELLGELNADPALLMARLEVEPNTSSRRALLLALGGYRTDQISSTVREAVVAHAAQLYVADPDAGIHAASEWLLKQWHEISRLSNDATQPAKEPAAANEAATAGAVAATARWRPALEGHTLAVMDGGATFTMGSPAIEPRRSVAERPHAMTIGRRFAIGTQEVSQAQFRRFIKATGLKMPPITRKHSPDDNGPMIMVTWYRAAQYCRWLSEQAGLPEDQMCYPPIDQIKEGMTPAENYLDRTGFRLPTEAEWEFASRAGAASSRAFGNSDALLPRYAWFLDNADDRAWLGGSLKPNDFGLFDMYGNAWEWCHERWTSYWENPAATDAADVSPIVEGSNRVLRGGSFDSPAKVVRSAYRDRLEKAQFASDEIGFRIAKTVAE